MLRKLKPTYCFVTRSIVPFNCLQFYKFATFRVLSVFILPYCQEFLAYDAYCPFYVN